VAIAPALCCCQTRFISGHTATLPNSSTQTTDTEPSASCCHTEKIVKPVKNSDCCHEEPAGAGGSSNPNPGSKPPASCCCATDRVDATAPKESPQLAPLEWSGELVSLAHFGFVDFTPKYLSLVDGLLPPERAGVDTRFAALFERHVLRC